MEQDETTLLELLDRVVDKGVWLRGDLTVAVAGVDLLYIGLQAVLTSVARLKGGAGVHIRPDSGGDCPGGGGAG